MFGYKLILKISFKDAKSNHWPARIILDTTSCFIERPSEHQRIFYSGKSKKHEIKYELGIDMDGTIIWVSGGWPGSLHDLTIARQSGILEKLGEGELIIADKAYLGDPHFLTPLKGKATSVHGLCFNKLIAQIRIAVEHTFAYFKAFSCLSKKWRHKLCLHRIVFFVLANIINLELKLTQ